MIKVRFVDSFPNSFADKKRAISYSEEDFYGILNGRAWVDEKYAPFRDEESLRFIEEVDKATLVEGEWYAMVTPFGKTCLSALSGGTKYALVLVANSAKGVYTEYFHAGENVWKILGELPMDILIAIRRKDMIFPWNCPMYCDYVLENYLHEGKETVAYVHNKEYFTEPYFKEGYWHISGFDNSICYRRQMNIRNVLAYIEKNAKPKEKLYDDLKEYSTLELQELLQPLLGEDEPLIYSDYQWYVDDLKRSMDEEDEEYKMYLEKYRSDAPEEYEEYLYYMNDLKFVNHMAYIPEMGWCRRQKFLIIQKNTDGSYCIYSRLSIKNPSYNEILEDVIPYAKEDAERFLLVVDVNEIIIDDSDIENAYLGFKISKDRIELYDENEALCEFGKMLKEAYESGNYIIDDGVY